jgi:hypothetical protein
VVVAIKDLGGHVHCETAAIAAALVVALHVCLPVVIVVQDFGGYVHCSMQQRLQRLLLLLFGQ